MSRPSLHSHSRRALRAGTVLTAAPLALVAAGALALGFASARPGSDAAAVTVDIPKSAVGAYDVDAVHSMVGFKIKHLDVSYSYGRFDKFSGEVVLGATAADSSVRITIDPHSVNSGNADRDTHLRNTDFLDVKQFAEATFASTKIADKDADTFTVTGDLTLHGVTKPVTFDMDLVGAKETGERTGFRAGFFGELTIQRRDFGIDTYPKEMLGDAITLTFAIECAKRK
jgi:polyisoprenoid-binding protein YceI